ncbi:MAG TPA: prepilin-type N-terminal cleavage/methylation domain-containing protein [Terriglobales bacterium]|nr:prepilin-type N-terminal cleavage/methylation domain-containing protein [Terriglobales bacterium]
MKLRPNGLKAHAKGFSLMEMVVALALLTIVLAVALSAVSQLQQRNSGESYKVDTVQETRDFIDQMVHDVHDVGYPPRRVKASNPACATDANTACGVTFFNNTRIEYEGDLDGTGTVYHIYVQLAVPASGNCPCKLQRGVVTKTAYLGGTPPDYYTEVDGILNSGNGAGVATYPVVLSGPGSYSSYATADLFDAYDQNASPVGSCVDSVSCSSITSLQITANVVPSLPDAVTHIFPVVSITSRGRLNNAIVD